MADEQAEASNSAVGRAQRAEVLAAAERAKAANLTSQAEQAVGVTRDRLEREARFHITAAEHHEEAAELHKVHQQHLDLAKEKDATRRSRQNRK